MEPLKKITSTIGDYLQSLVEVIYPNLCIICQKETPINGRELCLLCLTELPYTDHFEYNNNHITKKFYGRLQITHGAALLSYYKGSMFTDMLHRFKYEGAKDIGFMLGRMTGHRLIKADWFHSLDIIVPMPIHKNRRKVRGYNQSAEYAKGIRAITKLPIVENLVVKRLYTTSQVTKGRMARQTNVDMTFSLVDKQRYAGRHILLVDDVITTGATIIACAQCLLQIPGAKVSVVAIAFARY